MGGFLVELILAKKVTNNLPKFPEQNLLDPTGNLQFVKDFNP